MTVVTLTRRFWKPDHVTPATGQVRIKPHQPIELADGTVVRNTITAPLDDLGIMSVDVVATTDSLTPDAVYEFILDIDGDPDGPWRFYAQLPHDLGSPLDLSSLVQIGVPPAITIPARGPQGDPGPVGPSGNINVVTDYAALRLLNAGSYAHVEVKGAVNALTGVAGIFLWDGNNTTPDDGAMVFRPHDVANDLLPGRWVRPPAKTVDVGWLDAVIGIGAGARGTNTTAFNTTLDLARRYGLIATDVRGGQYELNNSTIVQRCYSDFTDTQVYFSGTSGYWWQIGLSVANEYDASTLTQRYHGDGMIVPNMHGQGKAALGLGVWGTDTALKIVNTLDTHVKVQEIEGARDGIWFSAKSNITVTNDGSGHVVISQQDSTHTGPGKIVALDVELGFIHNCLRALRYEPEDVWSWTNEIHVHDGTIVLLTPETNGGVKPVGSRYIYIPPTYWQQNNLTFDNVILEGDNVEQHLESYGTLVTFDDCRYEDQAGWRAWCRHATGVPSQPVAGSTNFSPTTARIAVDHEFHGMSSNTIQITNEGSARYNRIRGGQVTIMSGSEQRRGILTVQNLAPSPHDAVGTAGGAPGVRVYGTNAADVAATDQLKADQWGAELSADGLRLKRWALLPPGFTQLTDPFARVKLTGYDASHPGLYVGNGQPGLDGFEQFDTSFYRSLPDEWTTDDALIVALGLTIGTGGRKIKGIFTGTAAFTVGTVGATSTQDFTFTLNGVAVSDLVQWYQGTTLPAGIMFGGIGRCTTNTLTIRLANVTTVAIVVGNITMAYNWWDVT